MRIHSLNVLSCLDDPAAVLVDSEGFTADLSSFNSGSIFFREVPERLPEDAPLVVINPNQILIERLHNRGAFHRQRVVELWADSTGVAELLACLERFDDLAVSGASTDSAWFKIGIQASDSSDRSSRDLVVGLRASLLGAKKKASAAITAPPSTAVTGMSLKDDLIRIVLRVAKPMKPFLPASITRMLYKILGVLR